MPVVWGFRNNQEFRFASAIAASIDGPLFPPFRNWGRTWDRWREAVSKYPGCEFCEQEQFRLGTDESGEVLVCRLNMRTEQDFYDYEHPEPPWYLFRHAVRMKVGLPCDSGCDPPRPKNQPRRGGGLISELKAMYLVEDVAEALGMELKGYPPRLKGKCPFHAGGDERTPSCMIYVDQQRFYCFGCRRHGDVVDMITIAEEMGLPWHQARKH